MTNQQNSGNHVLPEASRCHCESSSSATVNVKEIIPPHVENISAWISNENHKVSSRPSTMIQSGLMDQLVGDVLVAVVVTASFTPCLTIVDKALVQRSAGSHTMSQSAIESLQSMVHKPWQFLKSPTFLWMWVTYAATYSTANCFKTLTEENDRLRSSRSHQDNSKTRRPIDPAAMASLTFVGTTMSNSIASMCKDRAYSRMFGTGVTVVPHTAYGLWLLRDFTVIGSSFVLPPTVARYMDDYCFQKQNGERHTPDEPPSTRSMTLAQFLTPVVAQVIAGPLHYLGLDYCNRPMGISLMDRWTHLKNGLSSVVPARMIRILPGYGVGGVLNLHGRQAWKDYLRNRPSLLNQPRTRILRASLQHHETIPYLH